MSALHLIAAAPMTAPSGREAGVRAQGATRNLDPRSR